MKRNPTKNIVTKPKSAKNGASKQPSQKRVTADATRKAILAAARKCFVKKGFAGAPISEIAKAADINQSLIYHHFANKEDLWREVKSSTLREFETLQGLDLEKITEMKDFLQFVTALVNYRFAFYDRYPDIRRMIDWQLLESSSRPLRGVSEETVLKLLQCIRDFQKEGKIKAHYEPELIFNFMLHVPTSFFRMQRMFRKTMNKKTLDTYKKQFVAMTVDAISKGLEN